MSEFKSGNTIVHKADPTDVHEVTAVGEKAYLLKNNRSNLERAYDIEMTDSLYILKPKVATITREALAVAWNDVVKGDTSLERASSSFTFNELCKRLGLS